MAAATQKPIQRKSWKEKISKNHEFFKKTMDYLIDNSSFNRPISTDNTTETLQDLYDVYDSKFPKRWFTHVLNPFSAQDEKHTKWPAKMRPANIISPNINLLYGEYPSRPFKFTISVRGDQGYNSFVEARKNTLYQNLSQLFINEVNQVAQSQENPDLDTGVDSKEVEMPESIMDKFVNDYRDLLSIQAQTDLDLIMEDQKVKEKLTDSFKHWLIAGGAYSYKDVIRDKVVYEDVDPRELDFDMSPNVKYLEDGEWAVRRIPQSISNLVDRFYDSLSTADIDKMESGVMAGSPANFNDYLVGKYKDQDKIWLYHCVWKSLKKIIEITYPDPVTGEEQVRLEDEEYKALPELGEVAKSYWVVEVLEGYRIGDDLYLEMKRVNYQPNQINNYSHHKLPYNGRRYSANTSILKMGLPFQILYCIIFFTLEKTIAKSRGKIMLLDSNVIPRTEGWDEEKFFWYSEAQGYMLINRNQVGVDKSFNQYQALDLGMFDHIAELIKLMEFCKQQYDDQLGITRQRKGDVKATDTATGTAASLNQSSVITEMIFTNFDQFVRTELEGLLNCSQIANIKGKRAVFTSSDMRTSLLEINPDYYCYADMGIMMIDSSQEREQLARIRQYAQAFAQNESSEAVIAVETANNISQLKAVMKQVKEAQMKLSEQNAQSEHERELEKIEVEKQYDEYIALLDTQKMHEEYDRKDDMIITQGNINMAIEAATAGIAGGGGVDMAAFAQERDKTMEDSRLKEKEIDRKIAADKAKQAQDMQTNKNKAREIQMKERVAKANAAAKRKTSK